MVARLRTNRDVSNVQAAVTPASTIIIVDMTVIGAGGRACPDAGPRTGRMVITLQKSGDEVRVGFDVAIPRLIRAAFGKEITASVAAELGVVLGRTSAAVRCSETSA
jgi:hypothetical protein